MRRPNRQRNVHPGKIESCPEEINLATVAKKASFIGSVEHKDTPSFAGQAKPRSDCELCPAEFCDKQRELTRWLREAIRQGKIGGPWENGFPRYAWVKREGRVFAGRLTNQAQGHYKGWPIENPALWPEGL